MLNDFTLNEEITGELKLFRTLWKHSTDNMFIVSLDENNDFIIDNVNRAQELLFKLEPKSLNGLKIKDILPPEIFTQINQHYKECIQENKVLNYDESAFLDQDNERFFNTTILPVIEGESRRIFGISRDITILIKAQEELEHKVKERTKELEVLAFIDPLTNVYNRRYFFEAGQRMHTKNIALNQSLSLILIDIDYFKQINDEKGHQFGDKVLQSLGMLFKRTLNEEDIISRFGGDEFMILTSKNKEESKIFFENLKDDIQKVGCTLSIGISEYEENNNLDDMIRKADIALYHVKNSGRDGIYVL